MIEKNALMMLMCLLPRFHLFYESEILKSKVWRRNGAIEHGTGLIMPYPNVQPQPAAQEP